MKGVHGLLGDHLGDHSGQVMSEINKLPLPANEKVMLQAMENMEESVLAAILEAIEGVRKKIDDHADRLDGHGSAVDQLSKSLDAMPDHDSLMKGVHGLLGDHLGDHSGQVMSEINKLPLPANEKVMLQAMENMEESVLATILEAIEGVRKQVADHADRLDSHGKGLQSLLDGMPDEKNLMKGVHGLLGEHLGDHSGQVMSEISKLPLPADEKVMLQAMENMEESVLKATLQAIEGVKLDIYERMPNHESIMQGVQGLLGEHVSAHSENIMNEINKLPIPADEQVMLMEIERMLQQAIGGMTFKSVGGAMTSETSSFQPAPRAILNTVQRTPRAPAEVRRQPSPPAERPSPPQAKERLSSPPAKEAAPTPSWLKDSPRVPLVKNDALSNSSTSIKDTGGLSKYMPSRSGRSETASPASTGRLSRPSSTVRSSSTVRESSGPALRERSVDASFSCKCGFSCGTESALSRHLAKNTERGHGRI